MAQAGQTRFAGVFSTGRHSLLLATICLVIFLVCICQTAPWAASTYRLASALCDAIGHNQSVNFTRHLPLERQLHSETCLTSYFRISAVVVIRQSLILRPQCAAERTFDHYLLHPDEVPSIASAPHSHRDTFLYSDGALSKTCPSIQDNNSKAFSAVPANSPA